MNNTEKFDEALAGAVNKERSAVYGHPLDDFGRGEGIAQIVNECPDPEVRYALRMIGTKIARLIQTPDHLDSVIDIGGWARTIVQVLDEREARDE